MNDDFVSAVMAEVRRQAVECRIPFTDDEFRMIAGTLDFRAVEALDRADGDELAWIGEGQAEARRATYGY